MSTYEKYIEANDKLMECYANTEPVDYEKMTPFEKEGVCKSERETVAQFISSGSLTFKSLVAERIAFLDKSSS